MFYRTFENLLGSSPLDFAKPQDIESIDSFLASLDNAQAQRVSPWRVSKKTGVSHEAILEVLLKATKSGLLSIRYEIWHPATRIKIFETFDKAEIYHPIECHEELDGKYIPTDDDIYLSFRLNEILAAAKESQKKNCMPHHQKIK